MIEVIGLLGVAALFAFTVRKRLALVATVTLAALAAAIAVVVVMPGDASGQVLELTWRMSELARLAAVLLLGTLALLVLAVWLDEPAYNFFPTALVIAAVVLAVLVLTTPIAIYAALLLGLLVPVGSFTFQVHRNRSAEAAFRHFTFVALGGCLGMSALALSASLGRDQPPATFVLLVVILVLAFALKLAAIPVPHARGAARIGSPGIGARAVLRGARSDDLHRVRRDPRALGPAARRSSRSERCRTCFSRSASSPRSVARSSPPDRASSGASPCIR